MDQHPTNPGPPELKWDEKQSLRVSDRPIEYLWHFVKLVNDLSQNSVRGHLCGAHLFRGQRHRWKLLPKIARSERIEYSEEKERVMLSELKRLSPLVMPSTTQRPSTDLQWLSLAQHHGMATRLLDWTENALSALWFTVHEVEKMARDEDFPSVWVLSLDDDDIVTPDGAEHDKPFDVPRTRAVCPDHFDERIRSQSGWFTLHHRDAERGFVPLEDQSDYRKKKNGQPAKLGRIDIGPGYVVPLRRELETVGVTAASVFPDLGGLCQRITERVAQGFIRRSPGT